MTCWTIFQFPKETKNGLFEQIIFVWLSKDRNHFVLSKTVLEKLNDINGTYYLAFFIRSFGAGTYKAHFCGLDRPFFRSKKGTFFFQFQGSIKNSVFDTFKMASDSISRNFQGSKKEEMGAKNSWTCPICLSDDHIEDVEIGDAVNKDKLPCNHEFHSDCLSDFIKFNLKLRRGFACPMCRKLFSISLVNKEVVKKR